jgi:uncharacterized protein (DUF1778 family)
VYCKKYPAGYHVGMGKKIGRPKKTDSERRNRLLTVRLSADEIKAIDKAAAETGQKRSVWLRKTLLSALNVVQ